MSRVTSLENQILEKIQFQWKTVRSAFMNINSDRNGNIDKDEFIYFLRFWGMKFEEEDFDRVWEKFDVDGDGELSYKDF